MRIDARADGPEAAVTKCLPSDCRARPQASDMLSPHLTALSRPCAGRVCMAAFVGWLVAVSGVHFPGCAAATARPCRSC
eukprot:2863760-Prymnesium_polylepis.1